MHCFTKIYTLKSFKYRYIISDKRVNWELPVMLSALHSNTTYRTVLNPFEFFFISSEISLILETERKLDTRSVRKPEFMTFCPSLAASWEN